MDDVVGDVLRQRRALDRGAGAGVAFSLLMHGVITAAAVYAALHHPAETQTQVIEIKLARPSAPAVTAPPAAPPQPAPAPVPAPVVQPQPKPQPVVEAPIKPTAKPAPAKSVPFSPYGKSTKKGAEPTPQPAPATSIPQPATQSDIPIGGTGAVVEGDFPYTIYIDRMKTLIGHYWYRPTDVKAGTATTVRFVISRDGTVRDVSTETSSNDGTFDRAALRAVTEASPLPPLPFAYSGTYLNVHLTFK